MAKKSHHNTMPKFMHFAASLYVPLGDRVGKLGEHWADFQRRDFEAMANSVEALAKGEPLPIRKFWRERTKGGSKDQDAAVVVLYLLAFAKRQLRIQIGAYDSGQADEVRLIIRQILNRARLEPTTRPRDYGAESHGDWLPSQSANEDGDVCESRIDC